jgi:multicomponent Na+:H+ antiporter subunit A
VPASYIVVLTVLAVVANGMVGTAALLVVVKPFFGRTVRAPHPPHRPGVALWLGPVILSLFTLLFGVAPGLLDRLAGQVASTLAFPQALDVHLTIFKGINAPLLLSTVTLALAAALYAVRRWLLLPLIPFRGDRWGARRWYEWGLKLLLRFAELQTRVLQNGNLRIYVGVVISTLLLLIAAALVTQNDVQIVPDWSGIRVHELILFVVIIAATVAAVRFESRLASITALGVVGFCVAVFFILFSAPDLAMTQFAIETLSVILIALIMGRLPRFVSERRPERVSTGVIALLAGVLMTVLVMIMLTLPPDSQLTPYFVENSYDLAKGRNIVNVILVDFRGFDTFGEITVLSIAGIGVYALSKLRPSGREGEEE